MFHNVFNSDTYRNALPICAAYLPLGLAYGIFAQAVGLNTIEIFFMSLFLFAITAQFIAISMIASGASLASIIVTVFLINSRHFLYSTTLVTHLKNHSKRFLSLFAQGVVDETFAVNLMKFTDGSWCTSRALGVNILVHTTWVLSSVIGSMLGEFVSIDVSVIGYMLTAMLIAGIAGGLMAVLLVDLAATKANIIIAALAAATLGYWLNTRRVKKYVES